MMVSYIKTKIPTAHSTEFALLFCKMLDIQTKGYKFIGRHAKRFAAKGGTDANV